MNRVGVLGATSFVGQFLLADLVDSGNQVVALSRQPIQAPFSAVEWVKIPKNLSLMIFSDDIPHWVTLLPIWQLPEYFSVMQDSGIKRLVALSTTSRFTKDDSPYLEERELVQRITAAEEKILAWGEKNQIQVVLLQPTMIYAAGQDKNVSAIARFIRKFGFFPLLGGGRGLRQPVHGRDVALACQAALVKEKVKSSYILSGGETLSYRDMVERIFLILNKPVRLISCPLWLFRMGIIAAGVFGKKIPAGVAERMNQDLIFDHSEATDDLGFVPRKFELSGFNVSGKT